MQGENWCQACDSCDSSVSGSIGDLKLIWAGQGVTENRTDRKPGTSFWFFGKVTASYTHTTVTAGDIIYKEDVSELRTKLDEALTALGITTSNYTDNTLTGAPNGTTIKGVHIRELRTRSTSGAGNSTSGGSSGGLHYVLSDLQGSARAVMSGSSIIARHDYLPFGEEIGTIGGRTTGQGYTATDLNRWKYAMTERDATSGLDHTWWRKYESLSGRWTSPDPYPGSMTIADAQSFNRYTYVQNDPVNFVDPSGLDNCLPFIGCIGPIGPGTSEVTVPIPPSTSGTGVDSDFRIVEDMPGGGEQGGGPQNPWPVTGAASGTGPRASAVRCPPTGKQLAENPTVKAAIKEAFKRADQFRNERGYWVEHGGWIYQNRKTGRISTFIKTPDTSPPLPRNYPYLDYGTGVYLHSPPTRLGSNIVGVFHIHPENGAPNEYDDAAGDRHKAPGVVGTPDGKTYQYGNYQRGIFGEGTPEHCR